MTVFSLNKDELVIETLNISLIKEIIKGDFISENILENSLEINGSTDDRITIEYDYEEIIQNLLDNSEVFWFYREGSKKESIASDDTIDEYFKGIEEISSMTRRKIRSRKIYEKYKNYFLSNKIKIFGSEGEIMVEETIKSSNINNIDKSFILTKIETTEIPKGKRILFLNNIENIKGNTENIQNKNDILNYFDSGNLSIPIINKPIIKTKATTNPIILKKVKEEKTLISNFESIDFNIIRDLLNKELLEDKILNDYFYEFKSIFENSTIISEYTDDWNEVSKLMKEKYDYTCQECGYKAKNDFDKQNIQTHHINRDTLNNSEDNLIVLCTNCHSKKEGKGHNRLKWKH